MLSRRRDELRQSRAPSASAARPGRPGRLRALAASRRRRASRSRGRAPRSATTPSAVDAVEVGDDEVDAVQAGLLPDAVVSCTSWPAAPSVASTRLREHQVGGDARTRATLGGLGVAHRLRRWRNSSRTLSGRPHIWTTSARPSRTSPTRSSPSTPSRVELREHPLDRLGRGGVAEAVGDEQPPVPVGLRVGLGVDLAEERRRCRCSALVVDPQVELEVGPVVRQRVEDFAGSRRRAPSRRSLAPASAEEDLLRAGRR